MLGPLLKSSDMTSNQVYICLLFWISSAQGSFFEVQYPNVDVFSEPQGNVTIQAGRSGNIIINPGRGGQVFIGDTDFSKLATLILSLPPIWSQMLGDGQLGTFEAGKPISVTVSAEDPEGGALTYERFSGALPANVVIDPNTGRIHGQPPDVDAIYKFGIRATDIHGKYADTVFSLEVRAVDQCDPGPCNNSVSCQDGADDFTCVCLPGYGGKTCQNKCVTTALGVDSKVKKIPDAFLSAYQSQVSFDAVTGRLNDPRGWVGVGDKSWIQVNLGSLTDVYGVSTQNSPGGYITTGISIATSVDGAKFVTMTNGTTNAVFAQSTSMTDVTTHAFGNPVRALYIRFIVTSYTNKPGLRVEVFGCAVNN